MMCSARLMRRLPARESRCRVCSPEEASSGAVPFPGVERVAVGEPVDVADVNQQPGRTGEADAGELHRVDPRAWMRSRSSFLTALIFLSTASSSTISSTRVGAWSCRQCRVA
jgi:hypothetical protein